MTASDVARSLVSATSSSRFVEPMFWADPKTGIGYYTQVGDSSLPHELAGRSGSGALQGKRRQASLLVRDVAGSAKGPCPANTTVTTCGDS